MPLGLAILWLAASAAPLPAFLSHEDVAAIRSYVDRDRAYSPRARAEALTQVDRLTGKSLSRAELELELAHIAALADNGHSFLLPPQWTTRYPRSLVRLGLFADGLFVMSAPPEQRHLSGRAVVAINGRPWRDIYRAYARYQGGLQSFRDQFVTIFMETPALLEAAGLGGDGHTLQLTLGNGGSEPEIVRLPSRLLPLEGEAALLGYPALFDAIALVNPDKKPLYLQAVDKSFRVMLRPELSGAYVQINATRGEDLPRLLADGLSELRRAKPRNIVVDLRFNMGGDLNIARDFMRELAGLAPGRLYAITSGRTFSAAISSLGYLKQAAGKRLIIVGEPIGDRLEFWAEGDTVEIPSVKATMLYATERHNYVTGCPESDCHESIRTHPIRVRSLQPDIETSLTFADFLAGRDPAYDAIVRDIRNGPAG
ncbi:S41 family peptidase [Sphingosinicella rhizophila]|uniref:Peptidase S41 n=1 Tax=Sphingosinicella rhizophila TaxID=3050082 RepID=A0ABU3Q4H0_9SPHN|nr:hypothetical protein [Sphingosinicella sp. GR2756]MDT9598314.1 hypothetical protein [Sphingosinicella sp. GR2756]